MRKLGPLDRASPRLRWSLYGFPDRAGLICEALRGNRLLVPDPFRCDLALFFRTIHAKCGNDLVFLQPPNTKGRGVCIASDDCLRSLARVTPKLIGEIENVGEKVRHMNKWLPVSQYNS